MSRPTLASCSDPTFVVGRICSSEYIANFTTSGFDTTSCSTSNYHPACGAGVMMTGTTETSTDLEKVECCPGYYCPKDATCMVPCSVGGYCPSRATIVDGLCDPYGTSVISFPDGDLLRCGGASADWVCTAGYYCPDTTTRTICPEGNFCRQGVIEPTACNPVGDCPTGTKNPAADFVSVTILAFLIFLATLAVKLVAVWSDRRNKMANHRRKVRNNVVFALKARLGRPDPRMRMIKLARQARERVAARHESMGLKTEKREEIVNINEAYVPPTKRIKAFQVRVSFDKLGLQLKAGGQSVLAGVTGEIKPGKVLAIMGPSGAGKTTLLSTLLGKAYYGRQTGMVNVNGEERPVYAFKDIVGFVPQDDIMHRTNTVLETLLFSAKMRLPPTNTWQQINERVVDVMNLLGLYDIRNSIIGNEDARGISGGQRKRVSIGMEMVADPTVLFLDEPTSGLDSTTSMDVLAALKSLAKSGVTVITVLHQPRYEIFTMFDEVLLLGKGGLTVYLGPTLQAEAYFAGMGFKIPEHMNPADFYMDIISGNVKLENRPDFHPSDLPKAWERYKARRAALRRYRTAWGKVRMITGGKRLGGLKKMSVMPPPVAEAAVPASTAAAVVPASTAAVAITEVEMSIMTPRVDAAVESNAASINGAEDKPADPAPTVVAEPSETKSAEVVSPAPVEAPAVAANAVEAPAVAASAVEGPAVAEAPAAPSTPSLNAKKEVVTENDAAKPTAALDAGKLEVRESSLIVPKPRSEEVAEDEEVIVQCDNKYYVRRVHPGFFAQTAGFFMRSMIQQYRMMNVLISDTILVIVSAVLVGFLFRNKDLDQISAVVFLVTLTTGLASTQSALRVFGHERHEYWREAASGMNRFAYFIGKNLAQSFWLFFAPGVFTLIFTSLKAPRAATSDTYKILLLGQIACHALGELISVLVHPSKAQLFGCIIALLLNMVGGTNPTVPDLDGMGFIGVFLYSISYARYMTEALTVAELTNTTPVLKPVLTATTAQFSWNIERSQLDLDLQWMGILALVCYFFTFVFMVSTHRNKQK